MSQLFSVSAGGKAQLYLVDRGYSLRHTSAAVRHFSIHARASTVYTRTFKPKERLPKNLRDQEPIDMQGIRALQEGEFYWAHDGKRVLKDQVTTADALALFKRNPKTRFAETNPLLHPDEWFKPYV